MRAHDCGLDAAHSDEDCPRTEFDIEVWTEAGTVFRDEAEPAVKGRILLSKPEYDLLQHRLYVLMGEDLIAEYRLAEADDVVVFTPDGVLNFIAGVGPDRDRAIVQAWESIR